MIQSQALKHLPGPVYDDPEPQVPVPERQAEPTVIFADAVLEAAGDRSVTDHRRNGVGAQPESFRHQCGVDGRPAVFEITGKDSSAIDRLWV